MDKQGRYRISKRKGTNFFSVVMSTVKFILFMIVGGTLLTTIVANIWSNTTPTMPFQTTLTLLGASALNNGTYNGWVWGTTGLLSVIAIMGAVFLVLKFINIRRS